MGSPFQINPRLACQACVAPVGIADQILAGVSEAFGSGLPTRVTAFAMTRFTAVQNDETIRWISCQHPF